MTDSELPPPTWIVLPDQMMIVRCWFDTYRTSMNFRVWGACESTSPEGVVTWELIDCGVIWQAEDWKDACWNFDGALKWDGCINWQTNPEIMMHGCGPQHVDQITAVFQTVYHVGKRHFDLLGDEVPALPANAIELAL